MNQSTLVLSLIGTVAVHILILPSSRRPYLSPVLRRIADFFNLRTLYLEKILKAVYVFLNLAIVFGSIAVMFTVSDVGLPTGILSLLLGPLLLRMLHEMLMLRLLEVKNVQEINRRLSGQEEPIPPVPEEMPSRRRRSKAAPAQAPVPQPYMDHTQAQQPYAEPAQPQQAYPNYANAYPEYPKQQSQPYAGYPQQGAQPYPYGQNNGYPQQPYGRQDRR